MANYYGIRGRCGYIHAACLADFQANHTRYDVQDRPVSVPEIDSILDDLGTAAAGVCLHCGCRLSQPAKSHNELAALALASNPDDLRRRLQEARNVLTDRKLFGKGCFDFAGRRLIGDNGLALQWSTRPEPDQPVNYGNQQTNRGYVYLLCPKSV